MFEIFIQFILPFLIVLSVLVLIHELGHFLVAKKLGIKVEEFGFGFPPRVFGIKRGETLYSINLLPIGGFVKLYGEDDAGGGSVRRTTNQEPRTDLKRAFFARPTWQRALVVTAGVTMNFVLAVVIISYLFAGPGVGVPKGYAEVIGTVADSPAAAINLEAGDKIVSFNGTSVRTVGELRGILAKNEGEEGSLVIERDGEKFTYEIAPAEVTENGQTVYLLGVELSDFEIKKYSLIEAPFYGTIEAVKFSGMILAGLAGIVGDLVTRGAVPQDAAGPVGVAQLTGEAVSRGIIPVLWLTALLSLNLAIINVLPIPALDGGRLFFILVEMVTRKKVPVRYETLAHTIGLAVLLMLILAITVFDVTRLISGQSLLPEM